MRIGDIKMVFLTLEKLEAHYAEHRGKPFFDGLIKTMVDKFAVAITVSAGSGVVQKVRAMIGATDPWVAAPGTIRGDFGGTGARNLVHASASPEDVERERLIWI